MSKPQLVVIAGPNGAGKSTLSRLFLNDRIPIVNPDDIAEKIKPNHGGDLKVVLRAGKQALLERKQLLENKKNFAVETTLSGKGELDLMAKAKACGYKVNLFYVGLDSIAKSNGRVVHRVSLGGHTVPYKDIERRYDKSLANLPKAMKLADRTLVLDNSGLRRRFLLSRGKNRIKFVSKKMPKWAKKAIPLKLRQRSIDRGMGM
jgi:predicted ABC-type ATPase